MSNDRHYESSDLANRPGMYFNPRTEVLIIVDDSPELDNEIFSSEKFEGAEWILISDDTPIDEPERDILVERFQSTYHPASSSLLEDSDDDEPDESDDLEGFEEKDEDEEDTPLDDGNEEGEPEEL